MKNIKFPQITACLFLILLSAVSFTGCQKNSGNAGDDAIPPDKNKIDILLTDDPGYFDQVLVDIQGLAVKVDTSQQDQDWGKHHPKHNGWNDLFHDQNDQHTIWDTIDIRTGVYDLLQLSNGTDTLLSSALVTKGRILAFRLTLGTQNSLVKDSVSYPLHLWNDYNTVYIRVYGDELEQLRPDHYRLWLDFDAGRSVIKAREGMFYLRPFLRAFVVANTGAVQGTVLPADAYPVITLYNSTDTLYALPGRKGFFKIRGADSGDYTLFINASNGYKDTTITGISVTQNKTTDIGNIHLSQ